MQLERSTEHAISAVGMPHEAAPSRGEGGDKGQSPEQWAKSSAAQVWQSLRDRATNSGALLQELGDYLAELGCLSSRILEGVMATHFRVNDRYDSWYFPAETAVPRGISTNDLKAIGSEFDSVRTEVKGPSSEPLGGVEYISQTELIKVFLNGLARECPGMLGDLDGLLGELTKDAERFRSQEQAEFLVVGYK
jgi:hypothetical protein